MIKQLIKDISHDKITLTQALTRAKLIAYKVSNIEFKDWIRKELNGYDSHDLLPDYRKISCDIYAQVDNPYHGTRLVPMDLNKFAKELEWDIYKIDEVASIGIIESNLKDVANSNEYYGYVDFPIRMVSSMRELTQEPYLTAVKKRIQFGQLEYILIITKQKLLDALLELNEAFPNLEDEYMDNDNNQKVVSHIVTTNIYGNNASSNTGIGDNFTQSISNSNTEKTQQVLNGLRELGVPDGDINELQTIIESEENKDRLGSKLLKWCAEMATKAVEKGIDDKVPAIMDLVQSLIS